MRGYFVGKIHCIFINFLVVISSEFDGNNLSNTMAENLSTTHSILTVRCSQSILSTQSLEFEVILDQRVQARMIHLVADYERLNIETAEFHRWVMEMRSHVDNACAPSYSSCGPSKDLPPLTL